MARSLSLEFVVSVPDVGLLPPTHAEVAFLGRSNVGKSSVLNALAGGKKLAPVSRTPGRTRELVCFGLAGSSATVVDCPGYGYAKVAKTTRAAWLPMLEAYLLEREGLAMVMLLVDGEVGPTESDLAMLDWLRAHARPHTVIATKQDKVRPTQLDARQRELAAACMLERSDVVWVSATHNRGIAALRELVRTWLA